MKYAAFGLLAAFLALGVYGAIPTTAEGWYTPSGGFTKQYGRGTVWYNDGDGYAQSFDVTVDEDGKVSTDMVFPDVAHQTAYNALVKACQAEAWNKLQDEAIATIGENLHDLTSKDSITIRNDNTGQEYTISFGGTIGNAVAGGGDNIPATSDQEDPADKISLDWAGGKIGIKGWTSQTAAGSMWNKYPTPLDIPVRNNGGAIDYKRWYGIDNLSLSPNETTHALELDGWRKQGNNIMTPLADAIQMDERGTFEQYDLVVRNASKGVNYVALGKLDLGRVKFDGATITTNETDGAVTQGDASLYGWANASPRDLPRKGEDGNLEWVPPQQLADGESIAWREHNGEWRYEVKGASAYAGNHARHYFGTASDAGAALGWHELPNVTTNRVEGDNITIASTVDGGDEGVKRFGLLGWNDKWGGDPLFVVNIGGTVRYIPLPALTNVAACACSNKWATALEWIGDGTIGDDGITFSNNSLDDYLHMLGYVYSTTMSDLHFDNDGNNIQASFGAPANWADGLSVQETDGKYGVKGFAAGASCRATMSKMLSDPTGSDAQQHKLLAWYRGNGDAAPSLHYVPIGDGVRGGGAEVDDVTITTNTAHGATADGVASLFGWSSAENGTYLGKNENGNLEWMQAAVSVDGAPVDDVSITTNTAHGAVTRGVASLYGFADAPVGTIPIVAEENGTRVLKWGTTGNFGLTATKNGSGWTYTVGSGFYTIARKQFYITGTTVSTSGYVYLKVPLGYGSSASLVVESNSINSDDSNTYIVLYYCNVNKGVSDFRGAPHIQVWED